MRSKQEVLTMMDRLNYEIKSRNALRTEIKISIAEGLCSPDEEIFLNQDIKRYEGQVRILQWMLGEELY